MLTKEELTRQKSFWNRCIKIWTENEPKKGRDSPIEGLSWLDNRLIQIASTQKFTAPWGRSRTSRSIKSWSIKFFFKKVWKYPAVRYTLRRKIRHLPASVVCLTKKLYWNISKHQKYSDLKTSSCNYLYEDSKSNVSLAVVLMIWM